MLNCKEISEHASDYIDKNLPFTKRMQVRLHILMCNHCHRFIQQLAQTMSVASGLKHAPPSENDVNSQVEKMMATRHSDNT